MSNLSFYNIIYTDDNDDIKNDIEFIEIKKEIKLIDNETQTDIINNDVLNTDLLNNKENTNIFLSEIDVLNSEIESLKIKNSRLEKNFKEICNLLVMFTKIDVENQEVDKIRRQLIILVNRELRMHYAFPFVNILSNIK